MGFLLNFLDFLLGNKECMQQLSDCPAIFQPLLISPASLLGVILRKPSMAIVISKSWQISYTWQLSRTRNKLTPSL